MEMYVTNYYNVLQSTNKSFRAEKYNIVWSLTCLHNCSADNCNNTRRYYKQAQMYNVDKISTHKNTRTQIEKKTTTVDRKQPHKLIEECTFRHWFRDSLRLGHEAPQTEKHHTN